MADRSMLIIGGGIAGLATGCYAQMNGYRSQIIEMHSIPGGVCTSWKRKGYTFDGCIHHLAGYTPGTKLYRMWQELGAMPRDLVHPIDIERRYRALGGQVHYRSKVDKVIIGDGRGKRSREMFGFDPSMAPPGKGVLKVVLKTSYAYWQELRGDPERYCAEKERVADLILDQLEPRFPGLRGQVKVVDVATPVTTRRYTGNGQSFQGSLGIPLAGLLAGRGVVRPLPGLTGFYSVGQWADFPGLPWVARMGRSLVEHLCRQEGRSFVTAIAPNGAS